MKVHTNTVYLIVSVLYFHPIWSIFQSLPLASPETGAHATPHSEESSNTPLLHT